MHWDEIRDQELHEQQILDDFISEPKALRRKYLKLVARDRRARDRVAELERHVQALQSDLLKHEKLAAEVPRLTERLGSANAALGAYRAETRRLKDDLARLRRSRAIRISRALTRPIDLVKKSTRDRQRADGSAPKEVRDDVLVSTAQVPPEFMPIDPRKDSSRTLWAKRPSECTYEELKQRLEDRPTAETLGHVINRAWFAHGKIEEPGAALDQWPDLAAQLTGPVKRLADRIHGGRRMAGAEEWIPRRAPGAAYVAERNRLMYCVHSTPAYNSNGYSTRTRGVAAGLTANGIDVRVVARAGYPWDSQADVPAPPRRRSVTTLDGVDYVHLTGPNVNHAPHDHVVLQMADAFVREARLYRPSMIQAASNHRTGLAALIAARRLGLPFVYEVRGLWELTEASANRDWLQSDRYAIAKRLETLVASEADHVLAITQEIADELVARGVDADRISLLANGVDPNQFTPLYPDPEMKRRLVPHPSGLTGLPTIGFAGSMVDYEGLDDLLEASAILDSQGVQHHVVLAGSGPAEARLRAMAQEKALHHVTFLGRLPAADIPRLLSVLDVVACPRKSTFITDLVSPLKPLEAMSAGRAVVLSDVAPNTTIAGVDGARAVLHAADDPRSLADALQSLLLDADVRRRLGRHARRWVLAERSWKHLGQTIVEAHAQAAHRQVTEIGHISTIPLHALRVAVVADEFTATTLAAEVAVTVLGRHTWADQLDAVKPHLVFIESAWANSGEWFRGVGYYSDEEHADLRALIDSCRSSGIPTVFWNKEDPVHFARFVRAAAECDHIFTTDADMIPNYLGAATYAKTASALPFYAAPTIHNPLPGSLPWVGGASYAGTFYGERYAKRSRELACLLNEAAPFGLTVYDRQADNPDSPYRFPPHLQRYVAGSLPYSEVLDAYKAHTANLNVNSVADSPSMFSRRVVEVAASGAVVLSGPGRGITETFGDAIACSADPHDWRAWLRAWTTSPEARRAEAWLQMRAVLRSHTIATALTLVGRTAGLPVEAPTLPAYDAVVHGVTRDRLIAVARQSVLPATVHLVDADLSLADDLFPEEVRLETGASGYDSARFAIHFYNDPDRAVAEDLLHATRWRRWGWVATSLDPPAQTSYAHPSQEPAPISGTVLVAPVASVPCDGLLLYRPARAVPESAQVVCSEPEHPLVAQSLRLLVAGHDLKFARPLIRAAENAGMEVMLDEWTSHNTHDEDRSRALLREADVVFCEWGLGNAVWYSHNLHEHQRMVVRIHAQELRRDYLRNIKHKKVARFIFVGRTILESAVASHGIPRGASVVIPNPIDVQGLALPKTGLEAWHTLGLVGAIPRSKRPDLALDLLEQLRIRDDRYRLRIKGHGPDHYPWLANLPEEVAFYDELQARIDAINAEHPGAVVWDPHGDDMCEWFRQIGVALSVSDHESFHFTVADGAASGALPAVLAWPGAEYLYPKEWLSADLDELAHRIRQAEPSPGDRDFIRERFASDVVVPALLREVVFASTPVQALRTR